MTNDGTSLTRCLQVGVQRYTKNRTYWRPFTSTVRTSMAGNPGAHPFPRKNEFVIGGDAISRCLEGILALFSLQSLVIIDTLLHSHSSPPISPLTISMQIWTNYETHIFKKSGGTCTLDLPIAPPLIIVNE